MKKSFLLVFLVLFSLLVVGIEGYCDEHHPCTGYGCVIWPPHFSKNTEESLTQPKVRATGTFINDDNLTVSLFGKKIKGDFINTSKGRITYLMLLNKAPRLNVTGRATLEGGEVRIAHYLPDTKIFKPSTDYEILRAAGGVLGHFDKVTNNFPFLTPSLKYTDNSVILNLTRNDKNFSSFATDNQKGVARALDKILKARSSKKN